MLVQLVELDYDQQASTAGAMRWEEYAPGAVLATEHNARKDAHLVLVHGGLSVLVRDTNIESQRVPLAICPLVPRCLGSPVACIALKTQPVPGGSNVEANAGAISEQLYSRVEVGSTIFIYLV
jgi:hypothetical protein